MSKKKNKLSDFIKKIFYFTMYGDVIDVLEDILSLDDKNKRLRNTQRNTLKGVVVTRVIFFKKLETVFYFNFMNKLAFRVSSLSFSHFLNSHSHIIHTQKVYYSVI